MNEKARKKYRTLVRVQARLRDSVYFVIAAWDPITPIEVKYGDIPDEVALAIKNGKKRLYAEVDLSAGDVDELGFTAWEI